jgi:hypothetical protein
MADLESFVRYAAWDHPPRAQHSDYTFYETPNPAHACAGSREMTARAFAVGCLKTPTRRPGERLVEDHGPIAFVACAAGRFDRYPSGVSELKTAIVL